MTQLKKPEVKEQYQTIVIDTLDQMAWYAEQHLLNSYSVNALGDVPYGKLYTELNKMFKGVFNELIRNYGVIVLGHCKEKTDPNDEDQKFFSLTVNNTVKAAIMPTFDIMAFVQSGRSVTDPRIMHFRGTERWEAKSRFGNIAPSAEFSYDNLVKAINDAVGVQGEAKAHKNYYETAEVELPSEEEFATLKDQAKNLSITAAERVGIDKVKEAGRKYLVGKRIDDLIREDHEILKGLVEELKTL